MKISVITTSYNYANYISQTIESVLNQTYKNFEYIIFDDGSKDNSLEIINKYAQTDNRIKVMTHPDNENKGLIFTMECAIKAATGDYIIFVESDDILLPELIETKIKTAEKYPTAAVIYNLIEPFGDEERVKNCIKHLTNTKELITKKEFDYYNLFSNNIIPTFSCVMAKKDVLLTIPFEFEVPKCFDWYLWNTIIQKYPIVYIDKPLTKFRLHKTSLSCLKKQKTSIYNALLNISERKYKINLPYNIFKFYKKFTSFEKIFRTLVRPIDKFIYNKLYKSKKVSVIIES